VYYRALVYISKFVYGSTERCTCMVCAVIAGDSLMVGASQIQKWY